MKSLAKNSVFNLGYTLLNMLFPLITSMYVSRVLMPDGVGKVAYAQATVSYFQMFAILGIQQYGLREMAKIRTQNDEKSKLYTQLICFNGITTTISLLIYILLILGSDYMQEELPLYFACGIVIFWNYFNVDWLFQAEEEYVYIVLRNAVIKIASIITMLILVKDKSDYIAYAWITGLASGGNHLITFLNSRKFVYFCFADFGFKKHCKPIFLLGIGMMAATIYHKIDVTMLGILATEEHVGYYTYAHKIVDLVVSVSAAITSVFLPRLCFLYNKDKGKFLQVLENGLQIVTFLSFPMAAGLLILAPQIIQVLFGKSFLPAADVLRIFSIIILIKSFGDLLCYQLGICTNQDKLRIPAACLASSVNVVLNLVLIPILQEIGAAIASVASELIVNAYQFWVLRRIVKIPLRIKPFLQACVSTAIMSLCVIFVTRLIKNHILSVIIAIICGILSYFIVNLVMQNTLLQAAIAKLRERFGRRW